MACLFIWRRCCLRSIRRQGVFMQASKTRLRYSLLAFWLSPALPFEIPLLIDLQSMLAAVRFFLSSMLGTLIIALYLSLCLRLLLFPDMIFPLLSKLPRSVGLILIEPKVRCLLQPSSKSTCLSFCFNFSGLTVLPLYYFLLSLTLSRSCFDLSTD